MDSQKKVLFLSGIDFKKKSIQVIRKTPEAYVSAGWDVHYVVGRDTSKNGDYFYEPIIEIPGAKVYRFNLPLSKIHGLINNKYWLAIFFRIRNFILIILLAIKGSKLSKKVDFDIIYGYELYGILAFRLLRKLGYFKNVKFVIRVQGVYVDKWKKEGMFIRKFTNWMYFFGLSTNADLCIMTNDGTGGNVLMKELGNKTPLKFYTNGVNLPELEAEKLATIKQQYFDGEYIYFCSVSRLVPQKRVDRSIRIINSLVNDYKIRNLRYLVLGSGAEEQNLSNLINKCGLEENVLMVGSQRNEDVPYFLYLSKFFLSMDTISNVGNPLLEAVRMNKVIITLNNGDTGSWIQHKFNGLIYEINQELGEADYSRIAADIKDLIENQDILKAISENLKEVANAKLWTWNQRFEAEINEVNALIEL
jgi:glycosyltransferase involved in cell wall biosynthesis